MELGRLQATQWSQTLSRAVSTSSLQTRGSVATAKDVQPGELGRAPVKLHSQEQAEAKLARQSQGEPLVCEVTQAWASCSGSHPLGDKPPPRQ